jgi:hypothetical protein
MNSVTVSFSQDELNALTALLDLSVKSGGIQAARPALVIMAKLEAAVAAVNASPAEETGAGGA